MVRGRHSAGAIELMAAKPQLARYRGGQQIISLEEMDQTRPAVRRALAFRSTLLTERGGAERLSAFKRSSIDIVSCITAMVEDSLTRAMNGEEVDLSALNSL